MDTNVKVNSLGTNEAIKFNFDEELLKQNGFKFDKTVLIWYNSYLYEKYELRRVINGKRKAFIGYA